MDIRCIKCAEPIDLDELHYVEGKTFSEAREAFYRDGCVGIDLTCNESVSAEDKQTGAIASALYDLLGDDIDGAAAMLEDYEMGAY